VFQGQGQEIATMGSLATPWAVANFTDGGEFSADRSLDLAVDLLGWSLEQTLCGGQRSLMTFEFGERNSDPRLDLG